MRSSLVSLSYIALRSKKDETSQRKKLMEHWNTVCATPSSWQEWTLVWEPESALCSERSASAKPQSNRGKQ
jgi:hypothetical protein